MSTEPEVGQSPPLRYRVARAALAAGTAQGLTRVLTLVLSLATARALTPREVGILGLAVIISGVISMLCYYPETAAVAAGGQPLHHAYALAALIVRAALLALSLIAVLATFPLLSELLVGAEGGASELQALLKLMLWMPVLELLSSYPRVILQRQLDLGLVALVGSLQSALFVGGAIGLLGQGGGAWGVAWAMLMSLAVAALLVWLRLWRQGWVAWQGWPSAQVWRATAGGSGRIFVGGFGGFLGERLDNLLTAAALGPTAMSFYALAWNGARAPANIFGGAINFVFVPTLATMQDEPQRVRRALHEALRHSYLLLAPICAVLFVSAPLLVSYVLGERWLPLVPCLRVMSITVLTIPVLFAAGALLTGTGRAHLMGIAMLVHLAVLAVTIPLLARRFGIIGAAYGDLSAMTASTTVLCLTARRATRQKDWALRTTMLPPIVAAALIAAPAWFVGASYPHNLARLVGEVCLTLGGYLVLLMALGGTARLLELANLLRRALHWRRSFEVSS